MKKIFSFILFALLCFLANSQPRFNRIYRMFTIDSTGRQAATVFRSLRVVGNNIYTAGVAVRDVDTPTVITNSGIFSSFDMSGNMLKNTYYGVIPTNSDFNDDVLLVEPNNVFSLVGYNFDYTFSFLKVDKDGNTQFKKIYTPLDTAYQFGPPPNFVKIADKYVFASYAAYRGFSNTLAYIVDSIGDTKRVVQFNNTEKISHPTQIIKNKNNNLTLCLFNKSYSSTDTNYVYISQLREIDTLGNTKWVYNTPRNRFIYFKKFVQLANGNYLAWGDEELSHIVGRFRTAYAVGPYLAEINPQRGIIWEKLFDLGTYSRMFGYKTLKDSSMVLACSYDDGPNNSSSCIIKLNKNRDSLYRRNFRPTPIISDRIIPYPNQIEELDNSDLLIGGYVEDRLLASSTLGQWGWLVRTDSLGCSLQPSSCRTPTQDIKEIPVNLIAYPNPTSNQLFMTFEDVPTETQADMRILDLLGKTVFQRKLDFSTTPLSIDVSALPAGVYNLVFSIKGKSPTIQKIVVMR